MNVIMYATLFLGAGAISLAQMLAIVITPLGIIVYMWMICAVALQNVRWVDGLLPRVNASESQAIA